MQSFKQPQTQPQTQPRTIASTGVVHTGTTGFTGTFTILAITLCTAAALAIATPALAQTASTVAGTGIAGFSGNGGPATAATLNSPPTVLVRADGSVLIADQSNNRVRKIDAAGIITTFAGSGTGGFTAGPVTATSANLNQPVGLAEDQAGNVYIGNFGSIQKVSTLGVLTTIAGNGSNGNAGDGGLASAPAVRITMPLGMRFDATGNLFFADFLADVIRKIDTANNISKVAGTGVNGYNGDGIAATAAHLNRPAKLVVANDGSIIVAEGNSHRLRKFTPGGNISTIAGTGAPTSTGDNGQATLATFNAPLGLELDPAGNLYVAEYDGNRVRKIAANGIVTTIMGDGTATNGGDGGPAASATIVFANSISRNAAGDLYITSQNANKVRKITFPPPPLPGPSVFKSFANTVTAGLGTVSPEGDQTVPYGGKVAVSVTAKPRHVLRVASNCDYVKTSMPVPFVPIGTGLDTFDVTVNGPCQMEATFTPLIPRANINTETAANALFAITERANTYTAPTSIAQTTSFVGKPVTFKAWVTDIAGVPYASATNVITFKANGVAIAGCANVALTLRASNVIHIREANCTTAFSPAGNVTVTSEFAGDTYNFPAVSGVLNHSVVASQ